MPVQVSSLNWPAVLVAAAATFFVGGLWYTALFGKLWQRLNGYSDEKLSAMRKKRPPPVFFATLIACYVVVSIAAGLIVTGLDVRSAPAGAAVGLVLWVGVMAVQASGHVASDKPWSALALDGAYQLIYLPMTGAILAWWR